MGKPTDKEFLEFNKKLWKLIDEHSPKEDKSSYTLMVSGCLLNACLKSYVATLGTEPTIAMFEMAISQLTMEQDTRILHWQIYLINKHLPTLLTGTLSG